MRILLIGATGGVGQRLHPRLTEAGHEVVALHRKPEQAETLRAAGLEPVRGDLMEMSAADFAVAAEGCGAIIFSAGASGSGQERTTAIDGEAPVKLIEAARQAAISRLYLVSVIMDAGRDREPDEGFEHYMAQKKRADAAIAASDLDYVIVRPGTLTDDEGDGRVRLAHAVTYGKAARGHVAGVLAELVDTPGVRREIVELVDGETPLPQAVAALQRG